MSAKIVILEGDSGTGKTYALRNMPKRTILLTPNNKTLPWRGSMAKGALGSRMFVVNDLLDLPKKIKFYSDKGAEYIVVDDFSHVMVQRTMSPEFLAAGSSKNPYQRYEVFGFDVYASIFEIAKKLPDDRVIVVINHTMVEKETGKSVFKIYGKMLGNHVDPVSYCTEVYHTVLIPGKDDPEDAYRICVRGDGIHEAKSPPDMHPEQFMPNDLNVLLQQMQAYYKSEEVQPTETEKPVAQATT